MTWCLRASCTLGPLLTAEPSRVAWGRQLQSAPPVPLPQGSAETPGYWAVPGIRMRPRHPWSPPVSSPSPPPSPSEAVTKTRAECTGVRWWEWSSISWEGSSHAQAGSSPIGNFFLPVSHLCPVPGSEFKGQQEGTCGLRSFHSHTTAVPQRLRSNCVSAACWGFQDRRAGPGVRPCL